LINLITKLTITGFVFFSAFLFSETLEQSSPTLENVFQKGSITVASFTSPNTSYGHHSGSSGLEHTLSSRFSEELDVNLIVKHYEKLDDIYTAVENGEADFAAANLIPENSHYGKLRVSVPYLFTEPRLIYPRNQKRPESLDAIQSATILVSANSLTKSQLEKFETQHPGIKWLKTEHLYTNQTLNLLANNEVDYAIINTNDYDRYRPIYPQLKSAFSLTRPQAIRWVFSKDGDNSLYMAAHNYLVNIKKENGIQKINQQLYKHIDSINYSSARIFQRHIKKRLPRYRDTFQKAADQHDFDWRLLAAVSYQESAWNAKAISPTGVRGLMMLTQRTAKEMGVYNRSNPEQSVEGGAAYLRKLIDRQPDKMTAEHKVWFGLAAYNAGYGHISDARQIAKTQGLNSYNWHSVKAYIPLLQQPRWYKDTRFGYSLSASQALTYVENIRRYYDLLLWSTLVAEPDTFASANGVGGSITSI